MRRNPSKSRGVKQPLPVRCRQGSAILDESALCHLCSAIILHSVVVSVRGKFTRRGQRRYLATVQVHCTFGLPNTRHTFSLTKKKNKSMPILKWPQSVLQILATKFLRSTLTSFGAQPTHFLRTLIMLLLLDFCACVNYCITLELRGGFVQFPPPQKHSLRRRDLF